MTAGLFGPGGLELKELLQTENLPEVPDEAALLQAVSDKVGPYASQGKLLWHLRASRGKVHWAVNSYLRAVLASPHPAQEDFDPRPPAQRDPQQLAAAAAAGEDATARLSPRLKEQGPGSSGSSTEATQPASSSSSTPAASPPHTAAAAGSAAGARHHQGTATGCTGSRPPSPANTSANRPHQDLPPAAAAAAAAVPPVQLDGLPGNVLEQVLSCLDLASLLSASCSCQALHRAAQAEDLWRGLFQARWGDVVFPLNAHGSNSGSSSGTRASPSSPPPAAAAAPQQRSPAPGAPAQCPARAPVPLFTASSAQQQQQQQQPALACAPPGSPAAGAAAVTQQQQQHAAPAQQQRQPASPPQHPDGFVSRWTGSSCTAQQQPLAQTPAPKSTPDGSSGSSGTATGSPCPASGASSSKPANGSQQQQQQQQQCRQQAHPGATPAQPPLLPARPPCGSWQRQFRQQYGYASSRLCPKCGASHVVPIVYGFPSPPLLAGMAVRRLVLGGDHLIESCHVWACAGCRSCFRFYPYCNVGLWLADDAQQQRQDHARAAGRGGRQDGAGPGVQGAAGGGVPGGAAGQGQDQQQQQDGVGGGVQPGSDAADLGFPRYTYEL